ncbi:allene oxide synthase-lipoxygenase protein-like [Lineus longissimus]|uniref:allene oxide synthase-lipoxygenase protein-like n=1 Tax=Lineus longissimus TaxID=88925 RepID=UPI00315DB1C0
MADNDGVPLALRSNYIVRVKTGDKKFAGTDADVSIRLYDNKIGSPPVKLNNIFRNDFERGHTDEFKITAKVSLGPLVKIEVTRNNKGVNPDWFVDVIDIEDERTKMKYVFPLHRWVAADCAFFVAHLDTVLPQDDEHKEQRHAELAAKRKIYEYGRQHPGQPVMIKNLPKDEIFSDDFQYDFGKLTLNLIGSLIITKLINGCGDFEKIEDIKKLYGKLETIDRPLGMEHWSEDAWFGAQRVMSCNTVVIKLCTEIPRNFGVKATMVEPFLQGKTLTDALKAKKIYICDLKIMEGIPGNNHLKVCQPLALFFVNKAGDIMPIAIQLFQRKAATNPVFLPSDDKNLWLLAKMWYNVADAGHHQSLTHLALTHLKAEGIAVCAHRNLSPSHPVFRLLAPHFLHIMAINTGAVNTLLKPGGPIDSVIAIGRVGFFKLLATRAPDFRLNLEGHLLNDLKERGVDDANALPFYPYRDDALLTWNAIYKYVEQNVDLFYETNKRVLEDPELQQWAKELTASFENGGIGMKGVPGHGKFTKKEDLIEAVTCIIFKCSVRHAAANFSQYDDYAFTPNYPSHLNGDPPTDNKAKLTEKELVDALPTKSKTLETIALVKILSMKGTNHLGDFEVQYLHGERTEIIAAEFRHKLVEISKTIAERNKSRKYKYDILDPGFIPNSISI